MSNYTIEPLANYHCKCGENPLWDDQKGIMYWVDIPPGRLFSYDPATGKHEQLIDSGVTTGGFTFQDDGSLLLFRETDMARFDLDTKEITTLVEFTDPGMSRFNDIMADPEGRVFAGTIGKTKESGGLYRVDKDGTVTQLFLGSGCANGMGFSPDQKRFWWTCSTTRKIFVFDYDRATGELSNRSVFLDVTEETGVPDGMAVDADGVVWSARWDGYGVFRYDQEGKFIEKIPFPVAKTSSVAFGGPDLTDIYVTTAGGSDDSDTADGTLYRASVGIKGQKEYRSRIKI